MKVQFKHETESADICVMVKVPDSEDMYGWSEFEYSEEADDSFFDSYWIGERCEGRSKNDPEAIELSLTRDEFLELARKAISGSDLFVVIDSDDFICGSNRDDDLEDWTHYVKKAAQWGLW